MTRTPRAFRIDPSDRDGREGENAPEAARETALLPGVSLIEEPEEAQAGPLSPEPDTRRRSMPWMGMLLSALGGLVSLWIVIGVEQMIARLLVSAPALGWAAMALAAIALLSLAAVLLRELRGILRERRIETLQRRALTARADNDETAAVAVVKDLVKLYETRPDTARARTTLTQQDDEAIIDAADRLTIAEQELLAPLDREARRIVANRAKQVSLVTAVSPRAIIDVAFVLYACARLIRQIAALYGGRPGLFGFLRLSGNVLSHLAVTGGIAVGDGIVQQVMGLGLAARVSAKLGEGVVNGLLTARIGLAAIEVCRPLPFMAVEPPRFTDVASGLFDRSQADKND